MADAFAVRAISSYALNTALRAQAWRQEPVGAWTMESVMIGTFTAQEAQDHFAHCVQIFGGIPATARRLGIDERAIRRFINGERPISERLLADTAQALRGLIAEAGAAAGQIAANSGG